MRIATWNVERLKHKAQLPLMLEHCRKADADILVLTETDSRIHPHYTHCCKTLPAKDADPNLYRDTENRVSVYTNYRVARRHETYDGHTAVCVELETERGNLIVYGTIMGIRGNREKSYMHDLQRQMDDIKRLASVGDVCVVGDYNCSFSDGYYFTNAGRHTVINGFSNGNIMLLTERQPECIDHIAISEKFLMGSSIAVSEWNLDRSLSDHKGIVAEVSW